MTEPAGQPEVEVERLAKTYPGGTEAVRGISFTVRAGEVFGLLGPNGALYAAGLTWLAIRVFTRTALR